MFGLMLVCTGFVTLSLLVQLLWARRFAALYRGPRVPPVPDERLPRAAVLLPLRGADPTLPGCLRGLLTQNYPRYDLKIIVDHRDDPSWDLVQRIVAEAQATHVEIRALEARRDSCSLKISALVQAVGALDDSYEAVVLVDADVEVYPDWLRDLATPLTEPGVGASNGVRWFVPAGAGWGTLVRYLWNAAACTQMLALRIPWGGSLAFRADALRDSGLVDLWTRSFSEDVGSYRALRKLGLTVRTVGAATLACRESTDLPDCFRFIRRQLLAARLYHDSWPLILAQGVGQALAPAAVLLLLVAALAAGWWGRAAWMAALLVVPFLALAAGLAYVERLICPMLAGRGGATVPVSWKAVAAIPLTQAVYLVCLLSAATLRKVDWRGITYEVKAPLKVRMIEYCPVWPAAGAADRGASLI